MDPVVRVGGDTQVLRRTLGDALAQQVAPGIVTVAVAPVLGLAVDRCCGAVGSSILRRDEPVQRIVREGLITYLSLRLLSPAIMNLFENKAGFRPH